MPRDLDLEKRPVTLTESPNSTEESGEHHGNGQFIILRDHQAQPSKGPKGLAKLHPYTRPLTLSDVDSCVALEDVAFPENERCSREKVSLRISKYEASKRQLLVWKHSN